MEFSQRTLMKTEKSKITFRIGLAALPVVLLLLWATGFFSGAPSTDIEVIAPLNDEDSMGSHSSRRLAQDRVDASGPQEEKTRVDLLPSNDAEAAPEREPDPNLFELEVSVRDELDLPVRGADVYLAPVRQPLNYVGSTGDDGLLLVSFRGRKLMMEMALFVESPDLERDRYKDQILGREFGIRGGVLSGLRKLEVVAGRKTQIALAPRSDDLLAIRIHAAAEAEANTPWSRRYKRKELVSPLQVPDELKGTLSKERADELLAQLKALGYFDYRELQSLRRDLTGKESSKDSPTPGAPPAALGSLVHARAPSARISAEDNLATFVAPLFPEDHAGSGGRRSKAKRKDVDGEDRPSENVLYTSSANKFRVGETKLLITVTKADGTPAAGAAITMDKGDGWRVPFFADDEGEYQFKSIPHGTYRLRAGGGDLGLCEKTLHVHAGGQNTWDAVLDRGDELRGTLLDEHGKPLQYWQIELEFVGDGKAHADTAVTDTRGKFAVPNMPSGTYRLLARRPGPWATPPVFIKEGLAANGTDHQLRIPIELRSHKDASVEIMDGDGELRDDLELRLWHPKSHRGSWFFPGGTSQRAMRTMDLGAGAYEYEVGDASRGWVFMRGFPSGTLGTVTLGRIPLHEPGILLCEDQAADEVRSVAGLRLVNTSAHLDILVHDSKKPLEFPLSLPAGKYRIDQVDGSSQEFTMAAGEELRLAL